MNPHNPETALQWIAQAIEDYAASLPHAARVATQAVGRASIAMISKAMTPQAEKPTEPAADAHSDQ